MKINGKFMGATETCSVFVLEKKFFCGFRPVSARLRATALGLYVAELNGKRVGCARLTPGWTSYGSRLQVQEYDVSSLLSEGENVLRISVAEGWYCGRIGWEGRSRLYGERPAALAELLLTDRDGKCTEIVTDESWSAEESYIRSSNIYDGEEHDLLSPRKSLTPCAVAYPKDRLIPQQCEYVCDIERIPPVRVFTTPNGECVYDFGQNIAGVAEVKTDASFDGELILTFAEVLDGKGNFYTANLRSAKATDILRARGEQTFIPEFTYHGFRYLRMEGAILPAENVCAVVRHTRLRRSGYLETGNARFDRLIENVFWSQRNNFVDIPTDCPQRDERLGWTGDINVFCRTAAYQFDIRAFMKKWLADLRADQTEDGVPFVVPDIFAEGTADALWSDCVTMIPWKLYGMYGDVSFLSDNFEAMKRYLCAAQRHLENGLIANGHQYGDWLALDGERYFGDSCGGGTDVWYIANVFYAVSLKIVADTARILGDAGAARYQKAYERHLARLRREYFTANGRLAFSTVTAQVLALHFSIVPEKFRPQLAAQLNENVRRHGFHVTTGFVGTPYLLFALADNGYWETARRVLLNNAYPGWLYEVDMGATTTWERWNAVTQEGAPDLHDGMNSFDHYAYGSVMEFVWRRIAGIIPSEAGFAGIRLAPHPVKGLPRLRAEYNSVRGTIVSAYEYRNGKVTFTFSLPDGMEAELFLPTEQAPRRIRGNVRFEAEWEPLDEPPYTEQSLVGDVLGNPKAARAFNATCGGFFTDKELGWMRGMPLSFMAEFREKEGKMKASELPAMLERANRLFLQGEES